MADISRRIIESTRTACSNGYESIQMAYKKRTEIKKFQDRRRVAIYSQVELTTEQKRQIDDLYLTNYGEKIPYTWHRHYTAFTGHFDPQYFPELIYIPEFERFMNLYPAYVRAFSDKNVLPYVTKAAGVNSPVTLMSCCQGMIRDTENSVITFAQATDWLKNAGEVFLKPSVDTGSGKQCMLLQMEGGVDQISGKKAAEILSSIGKNFVVQKRIICSPEVQALHPQSCNTFRIATYRWKNEILHFPVIMRIGRFDNCIDNAHAGGIFVGLSDDGVMKGTAYTEFCEKYTAHPDTGIVFDGYQLPGFEKVLQAAERMHVMLPQIGVINWDFVLDENREPLLIEANTTGGGVWLFEMAHGIGVFGEHTTEVLRWMREMKGRKYSQRSEIAFGEL